MTVDEIGAAVGMGDANYLAERSGKWKASAQESTGSSGECEHRCGSQGQGKMDKPIIIETKNTKISGAGYLCRWIKKSTSM